MNNLKKIWNIEKVILEHEILFIRWFYCIDCRDIVEVKVTHIQDPHNFYVMSWTAPIDEIMDSLEKKYKVHSHKISIKENN